MLKNWIIKNKYKIIWTTVEILLVLLLAIFLGYTLGGYEQYKIQVTEIIFLVVE